MLKEHRAYQQAMQAYEGTAWQSNTLVFWDDEGKLMKPRELIKDFHRLLKQAQLPRYSFHAVRNTTTALLLISLEIPSPVVEALLGLAPLSTSRDTLAPVFPAQIEEALKKLYDLLLEPQIRRGIEP